MYTLLSDVTVVIPPVRNTLSRLPGWYAFFVFLLWFGLSQAANVYSVVFSSPAKIYYTTDQLRDLVEGTTQADVIKLLGTPYPGSPDIRLGSKVFVYEYIVRDPRDHHVASEVHIHFTENPTGSYVVHDIRTVWIRTIDKNG